MTHCCMLSLAGVFRRLALLGFGQLPAPATALKGGVSWTSTSMGLSTGAIGQCRWGFRMVCGRCERVIPAAQTGLVILSPKASWVLLPHCYSGYCRGSTMPSCRKCWVVLHLLPCCIPCCFLCLLPTRAAAPTAPQTQRLRPLGPARVFCQLAFLCGGQLPVPAATVLCSRAACWAGLASAGLSTRTCLACCLTQSAQANTFRRIHCRAAGGVTI